ncbi:hypothetical protein [Arthrobacter gengyunqii]|uniref:Ig-like domain repeat protein n=1 Tax=Arthrobacter gengyunqii TaxID=2886940 RepID=A0ABS8GHP3_9MICC|nr:hypothetical protein [Arthrobacter gengyunqii]MCC3264753.1 hypothetical protein [Arthrobacter gengyunqii]
MKLLRKVTTVATTVLLAGGFITATAAPSLAVTDEIHAAGTAGAFSLRDDLPLVDSQVGYGTALKAGEQRLIGVAGRDSGSALVRISVLNPAAEGLVSATGEAALAVLPGVSASTSVLVPVTNGSFEVGSSTDVDVRIELIATFDSGVTGSGGTVALDTPVLRGDSTEGLAIGSDTADADFGVGVVGMGGVPATDVRAAYVTLVADAPSSAAVTVGAQSIPVSAGTTVISTLAPVASDGTVNVQVTEGTASTKVLVRGYVTGAAQNAASISMLNGYNTATANQAQTVEVAAAAPALLDIDAPDDATHAVLAVQATTATATSHLHAGVPYAGRGRGVVVSEDAAADAQLVIAELDGEGRLPLSIRNGSTTASVTVLGSLAGNAQREGAGPDIRIVSPSSDAQIDLTEVGTFTITGAITGASANLDKVTVSTEGQVLGTASVLQTGNGQEFAFQTSVPTGGAHEFSFTATDRLGRSSVTQLEVNVSVPQATDSVISENVVVHDGEAAADLSAVTDNTLTFATDPGVEPGEFIVGSDDETAPEGYLRQAIAVDSTDTGFVIHTIPAALTDVILQTDVSEQVGMITEEGTSLYPVNTATPSNVVVDTDGPAPGARGMSARDITVDEKSRVGETIAVKAFLGWEGEHESAVESGDAATHDAKKAALELAGGIGLAAEAKLSVAMVFELKIKMEIGFFQFPETTLEHFKVAMEREIETEVGAQAFGSFKASWEKQLNDWTVGKVTFLILGVPVYVNAEAAITVTGAVEGEVKASLGWEAKEKQQYGFIYDGDGGLRAVSPWPPITNAPIRVDNKYRESEVDSGFSLEGEVSAKVGPELEFNISIYDAAGPVITAGALAGAEASFEMGEPIEWDIFIEGQIGASVRLEVPIIDKVLLEAEVMRTASKRFSLLSGEVPWEDFWKFGSEEPGGEEPGDDPDNPGDDAPVGLDPIPIPEHSFEGSSLRVTLYWDNQSDMDLHVQQPDSEWINYNNSGPSSTGGLLDIDAHASCSISDLGIPGGLENVYWPESALAAPGKYTIQIDEFARCGFPSPAKWVLKVYVDEQFRYQQSGNTEQQFTFNLEAPENSRAAAAPGTQYGAGLIPEELSQLPEMKKGVLEGSVP